MGDDGGGAGREVTRTARSLAAVLVARGHYVGTVVMSHRGVLGGTIPALAGGRLRVGATDCASLAEACDAGDGTGRGRLNVDPGPWGGTNSLVVLRENGGPGGAMAMGRFTLTVAILPRKRIGELVTRRLSVNKTLRVMALGWACVYGWMFGAVAAGLMVGLVVSCDAALVGLAWIDERR